MNASMGNTQAKLKKTAPQTIARPAEQKETATQGAIIKGKGRLVTARRSEGSRGMTAASSRATSRVDSPPPPTTSPFEADAKITAPKAVLFGSMASSAPATSINHLTKECKYKAIEGDHALLGEGGFGIVLKAYDFENGRHVALKRVLLDRGDLKEEYEILKQLPHPNIVAVYDFWIGNDGVTSYADMYMEWVSEGSLKKVLRAQGRRLYEVLVRKFARQTLLALAHLHENGIVHRDVKPDNLLVTSTGTVKLSDMGISAQFLPCKSLVVDGESTVQQQSEGQRRLSQAGTLNYMAPECLQNGCSQIGPAADVWAWACTVCEMGSRKLPWHEAGIKVTEPFSLMLHIVNAKPPNHHPTIPPTLSHTVRNLLLRCFDLNPSNRPTPQELLATPYFSFVVGVDNAMGMDTDEEVMEQFVAEMGIESIEDYDASEEVMVVDY